MPYLSSKREELLKAINKHIEYKTCFITHDRFGIVSFSSWNINNNIAHVLITCIRESHRSKNFLKYVILSGIKMCSGIEYLCWEREMKTDKKFKFSVDRLSRRK